MGIKMLKHGILLIFAVFAMASCGYNCEDCKDYEIVIQYELDENLSEDENATLLDSTMKILWNRSDISYLFIQFKEVNDSEIVAEVNSDLPHGHLRSIIEINGELAFYNHDLSQKLLAFDNGVESLRYEKEDHEVGNGVVFSLEFEESYSKSIETMTRENLGKEIALTLGTEVIQVAKVAAPIVNGRIALSGFSDNKDNISVLITVLKFPTMPLRLKVKEIKEISE
jgi:SecD-like export protein